MATSLQRTGRTQNISGSAPSTAELFTKPRLRELTMKTVFAVGFWAALFSCTLLAQTPAGWPQWRGPERDGMAAATPEWPATLDEGRLTLSWQVELGPSYSGPVVDDRHVYTTSTRDAQDEVVYAFDRRTGKEVWQAKWSGAMQVPFFAASNGSWIRATPAIADNRLYVAGMRDLLVCLDTDNGKEIWRVDFVKQFNSPLPSFGFVSSPLVDGDHLYVQAGGGVVKLNRADGNILWRTAEDGGGMDGSAFSSPVIAKLAGKRQLIVQTRLELKGIDLESGKQIWSQQIEAFRGMNILTPVVVDDTLFTSAHSGSTQRWKVTPSEGEWKLDEMWDLNAQAYMSSPVVIDGHAYLHLRNQRLACINLATGEQAWRTRPFGRYWSLAYQGDKILALDENGTLRLIAADPGEFRILSERKVGDQEAWAHVAVCGGQVFVRELGRLSVFDWK
jgi:outer membrane protein assembly factor BamB